MLISCKIYIFYFNMTLIIGVFCLKFKFYNYLIIIIASYVKNYMLQIKFMFCVIRIIVYKYIEQMYRTINV